MPAILTFKADSSRVPGLDGFVTVGGVLDTAGDITFQKSGANTTTAFITFEGVPLEKYRRFGSGFDRFTQSYPEDELKLRLTPTGAPAVTDPAFVPLKLTIRAILEQVPAAIASPADLAARKLSRQSIEWTLENPDEGEELTPIESPDLSPILNEVLELYPADGRPRNFTLVITVSAGANQAISVASAEGANAPELDLVTHSILNQWRGDAPEEIGRLKITILEAVPYALYSVDFGGTSVFGYRATVTDTVSDIAAQLAAQLSAVYGVEHEDGTDFIIVTSNDPGLPFDFEFPKVARSLVENVQLGRKPVPQQTRITLPAAVTGGTWAVTFNFGNGPESLATVNAAVGADTFKTAIEGLATPVAGDIEVAVENTVPRTYLITFKGALAGKPVTVTVNGTNLFGCATAIVETVQRPGREVHDVFLMWVKQIGDLEHLWDSAAQRVGPKLKGKGGEGQFFMAGNPAPGTDGPNAYPRLNAGNSLWTERFESHYGVGNVRVSAYVSNPFNSTGNYAALLIEFLGDEAGIDHGPMTPAFFYGNFQIQCLQLQSGAGDSTNEYCLLAPSGQVWPTFTLKYDAAETELIGNSDSRDITDALIGLTAIGLGEVETMIPFGVADGDREESGLAVVKFQGTLANQNLPDLRPSDNASYVGLTREIDPAVATNEIQVIQWDGSVGEITCRLGSGFSSVTFSNATSESDLQTAFSAQYGAGTVDVFKFVESGLLATVLVRFKGSRASATQTLITTDNELAERSPGSAPPTGRTGKTSPGPGST